MKKASFLEVAESLAQVNQDKNESLSSEDAHKIHFTLLGTSKIQGISVAIKTTVIGALADGKENKQDLISLFIDLNQQVSDLALTVGLTQKDINAELINRKKVEVEEKRAAIAKAKEQMELPDTGNSEKKEPASEKPAKAKAPAKGK